LIFIEQALMDQARSGQLQLNTTDKSPRMTHCGQFYKDPVRIAEGFLYPPQMQAGRYNSGQSLPPSQDKAIHKEQEFPPAASHDNSFRIDHQFAANHNYFGSMYPLPGRKHRESVELCNSLTNR
jgi:hypothetical protein